MGFLAFDVKEFYFDRLEDAVAKFESFVASGIRADLSFDGYQFIVVSRKPYIAGDSAF